MPAASELTLQHRIGTSSLVHFRLKTDPPGSVSSAPRSRRKGRPMAGINRILELEFKENVAFDNAACDREGAPEWVRAFLFDSNHKMYCNNRQAASHNVPLDPVLEKLDKSTSSALLLEVERRLDFQRMSEEERWLSKIETDELRDAVRKMPPSQKELIKKLLGEKKRTDIARELDISDAAIADRIERIKMRLDRELPVLVLHSLKAGRKEKRKG